MIGLGCPISNRSYAWYSEYELKLAPVRRDQKSTMRVDRWTILACTIVVEAIGGLSYIFSLYSGALKSKFHLTQTRLDLLGTLSNVRAPPVVVARARPTRGPVSRSARRSGSTSGC